MINISVNGVRMGCDTVKYLVKTGWACSTFPTDIDALDLCFQARPLNVYSYPTGTDAKLNVLWNTGSGTVHFALNLK